MAVMTDISAVLLKSLKRRDPWDPEARQRVYTQARLAMLRKLWSLQPPLQPEEIEANVAKFDTAAAKLEGEFAARARAAAALEDEQHAANRTAANEAATSADRSGGPAPKKAAADQPKPERPARGSPIRPAGGGNGRERTASTDSQRRPAEQSLNPVAIRPPLNGRSGPSATILPPEPPAEDAADAAPPKRAASASRARAYETRPVDSRPAGPTRASDAAGDADADFYPQPSRPEPARPEPRPSRGAARPAPPSDAELAPSVREASRPRRRNSAPEPMPEEPAPVHVERLNAYLRQVGNEHGEAREQAAKPRRVGAGQYVFGFIAAVALGVSAWAFISYYPLLSREAALIGEAPPPADAGALTLAPPEIVAAIPPPSAEAALTVTEAITLFDGHDPSVFESRTDNPVRLEGNLTEGYAHVISTLADPGARARIGPGLAQSLVGKTVRVTVDARAPSSGGSTTMRFAYEAASDRSQWRTVSLSPEFSPAELIWRVPVVERDGHAIVIEPLDGSGVAVDVRAIEIEVLAP